MMCHGASYERVLLVLGLVLVAMSCVAQSRKIDCTRFVFAPRCRGVAAKRAQAAIIDDSDDMPALNKQPSLVDNDWNSDDTDSFQRLQFLAAKLGLRPVNDDNTAEQDLWERLMASRTMRH
ncbi:elevenin-like [Haliotis asinina]|uniref:elevenin-like n=1 Tax=Haliotis asinina TaxID=109174 RepID=UPI00353263D4